MPATTSLKASPSSKRRPPARALSRPGGALDIAAVTVLLAALSVLAVWYSFRHGYTLYYGDAEAHLNIARRILDSRTPGYDQIGTVWLPLPHALMLPLVGDDRLWRSGLAGAIPAAACFVLAGAFLYAALRRALASRAAAATGTALFALNPNLLYLQSTPMTEPAFFGALAALLYFTMRFRETQSLASVAGAAAASVAAALTRYEGWFLIPFVALYFLIAARQRRVLAALLFVLLAGLAPLYWLAHNWWYYGNPLEFYNGPYSAKAIYENALRSGMARYAGDHDWGLAWLYFRSAARLCVGAPLFWLGAAGIVAALARRVVFPIVLLGLLPAFYVLSIHSGGTPIFVPELWPHSYYNTRYGLAALPLLATAAAAVAALAPGRLKALAAVIVAGGGLAPWIAYPRAESWICWKESQVNSVDRRAWTSEAARYVAEHRRLGEGIFTSFGDLAGIFREAGIPLRAALHDGNEPLWMAATARPELFLWEPWAVAIAGDRVSSAITRAGRTGPPYRLVKTVEMKGAPYIEIYRRGPAAQHGSGVTVP